MELLKSFKGNDVHPKIMFSYNAPGPSKRIQANIRRLKRHVDDVQKKNTELSKVFANQGKSIR